MDYISVEWSTTTALFPYNSANIDIEKFKEGLITNNSSEHVIGIEILEEIKDDEGFITRARGVAFGCIQPLETHRFRLNLNTTFPDDPSYVGADASNIELELTHYRLSLIHI